MFFARFADAILGAIIAAGSLLMLLVIIPVSVQVPKSNKVLALSPDFWIKIIVWFALFVGGYLLFQGLKTAKEKLSEDQVLKIEDDRAHHHAMGRSVIMVLLAIANLFVYYGLIEWLGMILASSISVITFALLCGERRLKTILIISAVLPTGLYYFFLKVASIPMPLGIFE